MLHIESQIYNDLKANFSGELYFDNLHRSIYATDASAYRMLPEAVAIPKTVNDIKSLIAFATTNKITLIPRAAGTSLAGQCVGNGIVVDTSKYFNKILEFNKDQKTVKVQPGVIRDELNEFLKPHGLFFGPNTSTSNRCMIGGMVGNNSSGTTSIKYGVTRDKILALKSVLSDGSEVVFGELSKDEFHKKRKLNNLEGNIYKMLSDEFSKEEVQKEITKEFPKSNIHRRNTGYALDALIDSEVFNNSNNPLNIAKLLCGSEGTLAFTTEITLKLNELPPNNSVLVAAHFTSINESLKAVVCAMKHDLYMCELMDKTILDCTKNNREQLKNRFFVEGDPEAILMLQVSSSDIEKAKALAEKVIEDLKQNNFGYSYPMLLGNDINKTIELRKAGLGLLGNIVGDKKAVPCIEDTAVEVVDLPNYIEEFTAIMDKFDQKAVYYAHAGAGELHLRPILNLKKEADVKLFRQITHETALLVKKYGGSFSGEHGDGIVRAEFIPIMIGKKNYELVRKVKSTFDPDNIFNEGKIVNPFPMDENLRYEKDRIEPDIDTLIDFSDSLGILRAAEKCNGSGDCRKPSFAGGTMCPSYRATKNEKDSTRARANALREVLTTSSKVNKFDSEELKQVFDLCLSCKACASECPSNVDVSMLKAEFQHQYYKTHGIPFRTKLFASNNKWNKLGSKLPIITNTLLNTSIAKKLMGVAIERSIPKLYKTTFYRWFEKNKKQFEMQQLNNGELYLFIDEFTNYYDVEIGIDTITLLSHLGYKVNIINHEESGRSYISKGILDKAKDIANKNIKIFKDKVNSEVPLVGIEPSAILTFRDEYLRLADDKSAAQEISKHTFTIEEFLDAQIKQNKISSNSFSKEMKIIKIHGHCHQKALSNMSHTFNMLSLPKNFTVTIMNTGCCGMAGSFGYEKEHYKLSMQIGEESLFDKVRHIDNETIFVAAGTSCRHQINDGVNRISKHPISVLRRAIL
ncbi:FAD-linked oxidase C-terminal domain-containing protein [Pontimicrobium sp. SW4]|uniref:FAD-linked oxidase C-terminal domain-containing protein n=1 Tax=Pontimicrobium sp. SW4 TaxID=3153519 RepID=A0AAU7BT08_9FLAO